jgi:hypothetical protein
MMMMMMICVVVGGVVLCGVVWCCVCGGARGFEKITLLPLVLTRPENSNSIIC